MSPRLPVLALLAATLALGVALAHTHAAPAADDAPKSLLESLTAYEIVAVTSSTHAFRAPASARHTFALGSPHEWRGASHIQPPVHPASHELAFTADGLEFQLRLQKNDALFGPTYSESMQHWTQQGVRSPEMEPRVKARSEVEHCHYQGSVTAAAAEATVPGQKATADGAGKVGISTCTGGFSGLILLKASPSRPAASYVIEPAHLHLDSQKLARHVQALSMAGGDQVNPRALHIVYNLRHHRDMRAMAEGRGCGVDNPEVEQRQISRYAAPHQGQPHTQTLGMDHSAESFERQHEDAFDLLRHFGVISEEKPAAGSQQQDAASASSSLNSFGAKMGRPQAKTAGDPINPQRYVELFIANDFRRYTALGQATESRTATVINAVSTLYASQTPAFTPATVQIVLIGQATFFQSDPWNITTGGCAAAAANEMCVDKLLQTWNEWRRNPDNTVPYQNHDTGHLFSGYKFQSVVLGYAGVGAMCDNTYAGGIDQMTSTDDGFNAVIAAHEIGHNLGMQHDSSNGNTCAPSGNIMNAIVDPSKPPTSFSSCSLAYYTAWTNTGAGTCLNNLPTQRYGAAVCGNGYVEAGETCDCGPYGVGIDSTNVRADFCQTTANKCCDALSCQFLEEAECSDTDACCTSCKITQASEKKTCRAAMNSCDVAEVCDGTSSACPFDDSVGNGASCTMAAYGDGTCFEGTCTSHAAQCGALSATVRGGPWYFCPEQAAFNAKYGTGGLCGDLWCANVPPLTATSCANFTLSSAPEQMADGNACGSLDSETKVPASTAFCYKGACVSASSTNPRFQWSATDWEKCSDCNTRQSRNVTCQRTSNGDPSPDILCSSVDKPPTSQPCSDEELLCEASVGGTINFTVLGHSIEVSSNVVIGVSIGIFFFLLLAVHICVSCVKKRISDPAPRHAPNADDDHQPQKKARSKSSGGQRHSVHGPRTQQLPSSDPPLTRNPMLTQAEQFRMAGLA